MTPVTAALTIASIPSPGSGVLDIGIEIRAYGIMIGLGVIAAVWLMGKRLVERGMAQERAADLAMWGVPAGLIGARLYHVITDWKSFRGRWIEVFYIWEGGLGILGGIALGVVGGYVVMRRHNMPVLGVLDAAAPAVALAQAIGRWGNWWNQELYGRPTDLPWALEIDEAHRVAAYPDNATFHPTFLYESLWNLSLVAVLIWVDRRKVLKPGRIFGLYVAGYSVGRLWIEALRIDTASQVFGLRVNLWVFGALAVASLAYVFSGRRSTEESAIAEAGAEEPDEDDSDPEAETGDEERATTGADPR